MIIIATPTRGEIQAWTASDILQMSRKSPNTDWILGFGTYVNNNRTLLVHKAVEMKATHILFVDSDMRFPPDALERLLVHKKDIVGANYQARTNSETTARKDGKFVPLGKQGIEEVDTMGFGLILIDLNVFTSPIRSVPPNCFSMPFDTSIGLFVGEDVYFCTMARDKGFRVWVDHDLSNQVKHLGTKEL